MRSSLQESVQQLVIGTRFFPLTFIYRAFYYLSVTVATFMLRRIDGVTAIYLRRGLAKGEVVYGLSDIDLLVIIRYDEGERYEIKRKVIKTYNTVARFIPLFGKAEKELEIYSEAEFSNLYHDYGFYRYRFNEGKYTWSLLYGDDIVGALPLLSNAELCLPATEELKTWWLLLNGEFTPDYERARFKRNYLWYKALAEASKAYLLVCCDIKVMNREAALSQIKHFLPPEQGRHIDRVRSYLGHLNSKDALLPDELLTLFLMLVRETYREAESCMYGGSTGTPCKLKVPDCHALLSDCGMSGMVSALKETVQKELEPYINFAALFPQVEFDQDVLFNSDVDSFYLVLALKDYIPVEGLGRLRSLLDGEVKTCGIEPFIVIDGDIAFSLHADTIRNSIKIKSPGKCPIFFALLSAGSLRLYGDDGHNNVNKHNEYVTCWLHTDTFEPGIKRRITKIDSIVKSKNIYKMKTLDFFRFFWAAVRTKLLAPSLDSGEINIPVTSGQILEMLVQMQPGDSTWLGEMYDEYRKELLGRDNEGYRFFSESVALLNRI